MNTYNLIIITIVLSAAAMHDRNIFLFKSFGWKLDNFIYSHKTTFVLNIAFAFLLFQAFFKCVEDAILIKEHIVSMPVCYFIFSYKFNYSEIYKITANVAVAYGVFLEYKKKLVIIDPKIINEDEILSRRAIIEEEQKDDESLGCAVLMIGLITEVAAFLPNHLLGSIFFILLNVRVISAIIKKARFSFS